MASEEDLTSDSLDVCIKDVPDGLLDELKSLVVKHITEADKFSAQILTCPGQSAKLKFSLGPKTAQETKSLSKAKTDVASKRNTCTILVKNIPSMVDEDLLEVFFEAKKKQGGGPVKSVKLFRDKHYAVVTFEEPEGVETVMKKIPIKFGQTTLDIQPFSPLLEGKDIISHLDVNGLPRTLTQDILKMQLHHIAEPRIIDLHVNPTEKYPLKDSERMVKETVIGAYGFDEDSDSDHKYKDKHRMGKDNK